MYRSETWCQNLRIGKNPFRIFADSDGIFLDRYQRGGVGYKRLEGDMRKRIGFALIIVSVIIAVVACQPKAWWEDYWWPDNFPPSHEEGMTEEEIISSVIRNLDPALALRDALNSEPGDAISFYIENSGARSSVSIQEASSRSVSISRITVIVTFDGYTQSGTGVTISNGALRFYFDRKQNLTDLTFTPETYYVETARSLTIESTVRGSADNVEITVPKTESFDGISFKLSASGTPESMTVEADASAVLPGNAMITDGISSFIYKAETESRESSTGSVQDIASLFNLSSILNDLTASNSGISLITPPLVSGDIPSSYVITVDLDDYKVPGGSITGRFTLNLGNGKGDSGNIVFSSYSAATESYVLVFVDGGNGFSKLGFGGLAGSCSISVSVSEAPAVENVSDIVSGGSGSFEAGGETVTEEGVKGDWSKDNPYRISTQEDLEALRSLVAEDSNKEYHAVLMNDIELEGEWIPIGYVNRDEEPVSGGYRGVFDGREHTISGLSIEEKGDSGVAYALFSGIEGADTVVRNVNVSGNVSLSNGDAEGALIVGFIYNGARVEKCEAVDPSDGKSTVTAKTAGGIVARVLGNGYIADCINYADISGLMTSGDKVGGIVSTVYLEGDKTVSGCINYGTVKAEIYSAGIAGMLRYGDLSDCENYGEIYGSRKVGGIVGEGGYGSSITGSDNHGGIFITSSEQSARSESIGGIIGYVLSGNNTIEECTNSAPVKYIGENDAPCISGVGGIAGYNESNLTIKHSTNEEEGKISDIPLNSWTENSHTSWSGSAGGILGSSGNSVTIIEECTNYADIESPTRGGGIAGSISTDGDSRISNSVNYGDILGKRGYHGGITSFIASGTVEDCRNEGNVTIEVADGSSAGGIIGSYDGASKVSVIRCQNGVENDETKGAVTSSYNSGGLIGGSMKLGSSIENSVNYGTVSGSYFAGGLVAEMSTDSLITDSHNRGKVIGNDQRAGTVTVGGLVGRIYVSGNTGVTIKHSSSSGKISIENTRGASAGGIVGSVYNIADINDVDVEGDIVAAESVALSDSYRIGSITGRAGEDRYTKGDGTQSFTGTYSLKFSDCSFAGTMPKEYDDLIGYIQQQDQSGVEINGCSINDNEIVDPFEN